MAKKPFVVLDAEILSSSVWSEAAHVRLVWITLLILCDTEGYVGAAIPGIARAAGVSLEEARDAMDRLQQPDPFSRTKASDGRRVEVVDRGFRVLNFLDHLDRLSSERKKARDRVRMHRLRKRNSNAAETTVTPTVAQGVGTRDQGPGTSEQTESRKEEPPALPPADRTERALRDATKAAISKLYGLVDEAVALDPKHRDPTELMRMFTSYQKQDGSWVKGVVNASLLTFDRIERSIKDAEEQIEDWKNGKRAVG